MGIFNFAKKALEGNQQRAKVISLLNQKGGVGKTTMTFNLAHALKEKGHKVLCLDFDPQANLSFLFGIETEKEEYNLFHLLMNSLRELKALHSPVMAQDLIKNINGIDIISSGQELSGFELSVAGINSPRQLILKKFLEKSNLLSRYDYIVIDGPPTLGLIVVNILCASTGVLVPFQPDSFSRKGLGHFHEVLEDVDDMGIVEIPKVIGYIPNLVDARRKNTNAEFDRIRENIGIEAQGKIFQPFANKVQLVRAQAAGKSVFDFKSKDYLELQNNFLDLAKAVEDNEDISDESEAYYG